MHPLQGRVQSDIFPWVDAKKAVAGFRCTSSNGDCVREREESPSSKE